MDFNDILTGLEGSTFATAILEGDNLFPWIEAAHVVALVIVVGTIWIVDLRLLGVPAHTRSVQRLLKQLLPLTWAAFGVAAVSGFLMFSSNAVAYAANWPFRIKMLLLIGAGLNMLYFQLTTYRDVGRWDEAHTPRAAQIAGALSLSLWVIVIFLGRWIGFTIA